MSNGFSGQDVLRLRAVRRSAAFRFATWSIFSTAAGALGIYFLKSRATQAGIDALNAVAWQFAIWGLINLVFAWLGVRQSVGIARQPPDWTAESADGNKLLNILKFNHKLNWLWMAIGVALTVPGLLLHNNTLLGHGIGVMIQGGFLMVFDRSLARRLRAVLGVEGDHAGAR
jgi:hypothetical protein